MPEEKETEEKKHSFDGLTFREFVDIFNTVDEENGSDMKAIINPSGNTARVIYEKENESATQD